MIAIFQGRLSGTIPANKGIQEEIIFERLGTTFFSAIYPTDNAFSQKFLFNENSNINVLDAEFIVNGAIGLRNAVTNPNNIVYVKCGRYTINDLNNSLGIPVVLGKISLNQPMKITPNFAPLEKMFFTNDEYPMLFDTRNIQDLYLGQPCQLDIFLTIEY